MTVKEGKQEFPAMRYGPKGERQVFNSKDEVPSGWKDHPPAKDDKSDPEADIRAEYIQSRQVEAPVPTAAVTSPEARPQRDAENLRQELENDIRRTEDRIRSNVAGEGDMTNEMGTPNEQLAQKPIAEEKKDLEKKQENIDQLAPASGSKSIAKKAK